MASHETEIASLLTAPRNDSLVSFAPLFVQSFVSQSSAIELRVERAHNPPHGQVWL
jgi:hypothetical protein